jgi:hypothetical protein
MTEESEHYMDTLGNTATYDLIRSRIRGTQVACDLNGSKT